MAPPSRLGRDLGLFTTISISIGAMIGAGIFVLPSLAFAETGPAAIVAYLIAGLIALTAALSQAELATAMPVSGGTYVFINRALGPLAGTIAGLGVWVSLILKGSFALVGLGVYLVLFGFAATWNVTMVALVLCVALLLVNTLGAKVAGRFQLLIVFAVLIVLLVMGVYGLGKIRTVGFSNLDPFLTNGSFGLIQATALVFVSYVGLTKIASVAEEIRNPERNIPLAMIIAVSLMMVIYALVVFVFVGLVDPVIAANTLTPISEEAIAVWGTATAGLVLAGVAVVALVSMSNAAIMTSSRYPFAFGRHGMLPKWAARINPFFGTPLNALVLTGIVMLVLIAFVDIHELAELASAFTILLFMTLHISVLVLRHAKPDWYQPPFRSPFFPFVQLLGIGSSVVLFLAFSLVSQLVTLGFLIIGAIWYVVYTRRHTHEVGALVDLFKPVPKVHPLTADGTPVRRILVPLLDPRDERNIFALAAAIVGPEGEIIAADFQVVPQQVPLDMVEVSAEIASDQDRIERKAVGITTPIRFVPVTTHDLDFAIVNLADEEECTDILLDWTEGLRGNLVHHDKMKWVLRHAHANVIVVKDRDISAIAKALVYVDDRLLEGNSCTVLESILHLTQAEPTFLIEKANLHGRDIAEQEVKLRTCIRERFGPEVEVRVQDSEDIDLGLISAVRGHDLLVMSSPLQMVISERMEWKFSEGLFGAHIDNIAHSVDASVILLKDKVDD